MVHIMTNKLIINEKQIYGKGSHKKCFIHPDNKDLCIKVAYNRGDKRI